MRSPTKLALWVVASTLIGCVASAPPTAEVVAGRGAPAGAGAPGAGDPYYPSDGNGGYDALAYDVSISYDPRRKHLDGDTTIVAKSTQHLSRFNLDLRHLDVSAVDVDGEQAEFSRRGDFELVISPRSPIPEGTTFTTRVRYQGRPRLNQDQGGVGALGWLVTPEGAAYALGEPHSAAFWFPVNETPRDKARFSVTARVPEGWTAVSIGREGPHRTEDGWSVFRWEEKNPVASYLTTIAIDKFQIDRATLANGVPVVTAYAPGAEHHRSQERHLGEVVDFLSGLFGPYPQSAAGVIYLSAPLLFSLETQGRPVYAPWSDLSIVVHEYAHQWYGDSVSVRSWSDICLNECVASYASWLWEEEKSGADLDSRYRADVAAAEDIDDFWSGRLHRMGAGREFDAVYTKGALAMHALRRLLGDEVFFRVLKRWPAEHRHGNASWPQFERFVEQQSRRDLRGFFDAWFRGTEVPPREYLYPGSLGR